jgi:hypothetical protein
VGGSEYEKGLGSDVFFGFFFFVETFDFVFDMDFCKNIFMVFLNSPCRETPKNVLKKKSNKKKVGWWVDGSEI